MTSLIAGAGDEYFYQSEHTRVFRRGLANGRSIICKEPLGVDAPARLRHERRMLERLAGIAGAPQLAPCIAPANTLALEDRAFVSLLDTARLEVPELLSLSMQLAQIIAAVHRAGIIHKDINPANIILVGRERQPLLIDFDLATTFGEERPAFLPANEIAGTLAYIAPEQTGRTGRTVDQRADLYSLGVTLYELATGRLPFQSDDPLQLIHDHLARLPTPPIELDPHIPQGLSDIILRLLEKEPDRRYQSAEGLAWDLVQLRKALARGDDTSLMLGERDFPLRLSPPSRLIGRDAEIAALQAALDKALHGVGGVLIAGAPGVGKSALINELRAMVAAKGGWFVSGKFDQYRRDANSGAVVQVMQSLTRLLLSLPEAELAAERQRMLDAVGSNAGLIAASLPEWATVFQVEPEAAGADPLESIARLMQASVNHMCALASPKRPLVMVLDDLQWSDPSALAYFDALLTGERMHGLLVVGSYRETGVDATHPLFARMQRWNQLGLSTLNLRLENLPANDLTLLLTEMLRLSPAKAGELAAAIGARTGGNPYDTVELINALRREGVLIAGVDGWAWDEAAIHRYVGQGTVVDLLDARIARLTPETQNLLEIMACCGGKVKAGLLQAASDLAGDVVEDRIGPALEDGLLVMEDGAQGTLRFRHDRVQQAVHERLEASRRSAVSLVLARRLSAHPDFENMAANLYLPVSEALQDADEQRRVVELFRDAAASAGRMAAYVAAERFLAAALKLLEAQGAGTDQSLHMGLSIEHHAALYSLGRLEEADRVYQSIESRHPDSVELAGAACLQMAGLTGRSRHREALAMGLALLPQLGLDIPRREDMGNEVERLADRLYEWAAALEQGDDLHRPEIQDPRIRMAANLIDRLIPPASFGDLPLLSWLCLRSQQLWVEHGPCASLVAISGTLNAVAMGLRKDARLGYVASRNMLTVGDARGWEPETSRARIAVAGTAAHWFEPLEDCIAEGRRAHEGLVQGGDLQYACFSYSITLPLLVDVAPVLDTLAQEIETALAYAARVSNTHTGDSFLVYRQLVRALRGETRSPGDFSDAGYDEASAASKTDINPMATAIYHGNRALAAAIFGDAPALARHADTVITMLSNIQGGYGTAVAYLLRALSLVQRVRAAPNATERNSMLAAFDEHRAWMAARAADAPDNYGHLVNWIEAERACAAGDVLLATQAFDAALTEAESRQRPWHRALMTERAALFHLANGMEITGRHLLVEARRLYAGWGATGKVKQMEQMHHFLRSFPGARRKEDRASSRQSSRSSSGLSGDSIDLLGVLRASQVLSSETNLNSLKARVIELLGALTGATAVLLVLRRGESRGWFLSTVEGEATISVEDTGTQNALPLSVFRYAERTREPLLLEDALHDDRFAKDPYFAGLAHCSLLAVPILSQGILRAVLLLENRLSRSAFSADRLDAVMLIAGQLAVSLDNALLYDSLERKVAERTDDLKLANLRLEALSSTDPLTGLANRRRFNEMIEAEWQRAIRPRTAIAVAMIDIDQFKLYNDHYGHLGGDEALRRVARVLGETIRGGSDLVARYGGEEFVIVLPGADLEAIHAVAERARVAVEALNEPHEKSTRGVVTISVGIATMVSTAQNSPEQLIELADAALYRAKKNGRNRVMGRQAEDILQPEPIEPAPRRTPEKLKAGHTGIVGESTAEPLRILLIEDSELDAELILRELKRGLHSIQWERVQTAAALSAALERQAWDVVICDYHLPGFGALPALALIRQRPGYLPFIIVSGAIREETAVEAMKQGVDDYVLKSNLARLVPAIRRELEANERRHEKALADQALHDSLELYRSLADAMPMGLYRIDRQGRILFCNQFMVATLGFSEPHEYMGRSVYEAALSEDPAALARAQIEDRQVIESGISATQVEEFLVPLLGTRRYWEITRIPIHGGDGTVIGLQGVIRDVTESKRNEEALAFERDLLKNLMDNIPDVIYFKDRELRYIRINKALAKRYGLKTPAEAIGRRGRDFFPPEAAIKIEQHELEILRTGAMAAGIEDKHVLPSGRAVWYQRTEAPIRNDRGEITSLVAISRDISERKKVEQTLAESEERFRQISENIRDVFYLTDVESNRLLYISPAYEEIWGQSRDRLYADLASWIDAVHPDDRDRVIRLSEEQAPENRFDLEHRIVRPDGTTRWVHTRSYPIANDSGNVYRVVTVTSDITEQKQAEKNIQHLNRVYAVLSGVNALIVRARDRDELFREACRIVVEDGEFISAYIAMLDPGVKDLRLAASSSTDTRYLARLQELLHEVPNAVSPEMQSINERLFGQHQPEIWNDIQSELPLYMQGNSLTARNYSAVALPLVIGGQTVGVLGLDAKETGFFDAEEMKLLTELASDIAFAIDHLDKAARLDYLAYYDQLTGLANATLFHERLGQHLHVANSNQQRIALVLLDVERFKTVNDALGRPAGDTLLKQLAERLARYAGGPDDVAHLGRDHFAMVIHAIKDEDQVARIIEECSQACFGEVFLIEGSDFKAAAKFGIALYPGDASDAETLFRNAEAALKKAKTGGEHYLFYAQHMTERVAERLNLENKLRRALDRDEFVLHYQPKVESQSGHLVGVEALIRWNDPLTGLVPPVQFISLLEETGLILEVGAWALRRAVQDHGHWLALGLAAPRIAVNVSAIQLRQPDFVENIRQSLATGPSPPGIDLEITESLVMEDIEGNIGKLKAIREMGLSIAIDDFGTGYSSLAYLARLPMQTIKVDRSFVITMLKDPNIMTLVSTIISLAHSFGLTVVAEGVDDEEQAKMLRLLRCDYMQGYLFSKPVPLEEMTALITAERNRSS